MASSKDKVPRRRTKEPTELRRGKVFHRIARGYFIDSKDVRISFEEHVSFAHLNDLSRRRGRIDIILHDITPLDDVHIIEVKSTDWDQIRPENIRRNLSRHSKQLWRYIDKFIDVDRKQVGIAILYPKPPAKEGLKDSIEQMGIKDYDLPVYWLSELKSEG